MGEYKTLDIGLSVGADAHYFDNDPALAEDGPYYGGFDVEARVGSSHYFSSNFGIKSGGSGGIKISERDLFTLGADTSLFIGGSRTQYNAGLYGAVELPQGDYSEGDLRYVSLGGGLVLGATQTLSKPGALTRPRLGLEIFAGRATVLSPTEQASDAGSPAGFYGAWQGGARMRFEVQRVTKVK